MKDVLDFDFVLGAHDKIKVEAQSITIQDFPCIL
jgi:hypothetical protein